MERSGVHGDVQTAVIKGIESHVRLPQIEFGIEVNVRQRNGKKCVMLWVAVPGHHVFSIDLQPTPCPQTASLESKWSPNSVCTLKSCSPSAGTTGTTHVSAIVPPNLVDPESVGIHGSHGTALAHALRWGRQIAPPYMEECPKASQRPPKRPFRGGDEWGVSSPPGW